MDRPKTIGTLLKLLSTIVVAGVLLAGLLFPWIGGPALGAQRSTGLLGAPPVELTDQPPAPNTVLLAADGELITQFYEQDRAPVAHDQIAEVMKQAMVAIEAARFYEHHGLHVRGPVRGLLTNSAPGGGEGGGPPLPRQRVKQTLGRTA